MKKLFLILAVFLISGCTLPVPPTPVSPLPTPISPIATPVSPVPTPDLVWRVDHETGDLSQWDGESNTGSGNSQISSAFAHSGRFSAAATIRSATTSGNGTRLRLQGRGAGKSPDDPKNLPDEGYYSAWYYIPQFIDGNNNIFQWKQAEKTGPNSQTRHLLYSINIRRPDMHLDLKAKITEAGEFTGRNTPGIILQETDRTVPVAQWFQLECFYRWSTQPDGAVICWLDGDEIFRVENRRTQFVNMEWKSYPRQWTVNNYGISDQDPLTHTIHIDDVMIRR